MITAATLRLDLAADRARLEATIAELRPRMLVLDPFVRLHRIDENASGEVAPLLAFLRDLQRRYALAVVLVHHARKGGGTLRAGQALRGSSEFHAWGDSNLYLRRDGNDQLILTAEHRAASAIPGLSLTLAQRDDALALEPAQTHDPSPPKVASADERIITALANADRPYPFSELRAACRVRTATLYAHLAEMTAAGRIVKAEDGYRLTGR